MRSLKDILKNLAGPSNFFKANMLYFRVIVKIAISCIMT